MTTHTKVAGSWRELTGVHAKISGAWRSAKFAYIKSGGAWRKVFSEAQIDATVTVGRHVLLGGTPAGTRTWWGYSFGTENGGSPPAMGAISPKTLKNGWVVLNVQYEERSAAINIYLSGAGGMDFTYIDINGSRYPKGLFDVFDSDERVMYGLLLATSPIPRSVGAQFEFRIV